MHLLDSATHMITLAGPLPNPKPAAPPGMAGTFSDWISWAKYIGMFAGVMGLITCGVMMMVGRRNRSHMAAEGAGGLVWTVAGLSTVFLAVGIVTAMAGA
jgi:Type IV secretion system pilin